MLDRVIAQGTVSESDLNALINLLARFYPRARPKATGAAEYLRQLRARVEENFQSLCAADLGMNPVPVFQVIVEQRRFVESNIELLTSRAGQLVECHGDLRPEHVYLGSRDDTVCVIDCLEFDARLRRLDPLEELAFLALECRRLGAEALGQSILQGVETAIGDVSPDSLVHFYMSHRALTRAKVAAWHLRDPHMAGSEKHWRDRADSYIDEALHFAQLATRAPRIEEPIVLSGCSDTRPQRLGRLAPEC
jgi:aminoglycoside phosphotransferase family enzyme